MVEVEKALFEGQIQGIVMTSYQNERPLCGLAGVLDWHFHGAISQCILQGAITGRVGECVYFPMNRNGTTYHIILAGAGHSTAPGERGQVPLETVHTLQKNLASLKLSKMGISKADFGHVSSEYFAKHLKGASLWIGP